VLLEAIEKVLAQGEKLTGDTLRQKLSSIDLRLPLERVKFNSRGDPMYYSQAICQIQNGRYVSVYPPERATGKAIFPGPPKKDRD
jgi:branched-chain amino acid transport system substrate-binding protein